MERRISREYVAAPEQSSENTRVQTLERLRRSAQRSKVFRALLLGTTLASLQGCAGGLSMGKGPLDRVSAEKRLDLEDETLPSNEAMLQHLKDAVGEERVARDMAMQRQYADRAKEQRGGAPRLEGFEILDISPKLVAAYVQKTPPYSWSANGHLGSMRIDPKFSPSPYPGLEGKAEYGHCQASYKGDPIQIVFTSESLKSDMRHGVQLTGSKVQTVFSVALHEMAHGSDWRTSSALTPERSLAVMYMVQRASMDPERPQFEYPESIHVTAGADKKQEAYARMVEFSAELMEAGLEEEGGTDWPTWEAAFAQDLVERYHARPHGAQQAVRLVKTQLQWTDPSFKPWEAVKERDRIIDSMLEQHEYARFSKVVSSDLPDARISRAFTESMEQKPWTKEDVLYQMRLLTGVDESPDGSLTSVVPLAFETSNKNVQVAVQYFNTLIIAAVKLRANHAGYRGRYGQHFPVHLGNTTVEGLVAAYKALSPTEREAFVTIALREIAAMNSTFADQK